MSADVALTRARQEEFDDDDRYFEKSAALAAFAAEQVRQLPIHNPDVECCSRERIRAIQLEKLIAQVAWTCRRVRWYRNQMDEGWA